MSEIHSWPNRLAAVGLLRSAESEVAFRVANRLTAIHSEVGTLAFDFDTHAAGSALNHANSLVDAASVEVCHFLFCNILALVSGDLRNFRLVGNTTAFWRYLRPA